MKRLFLVLLATALMAVPLAADGPETGTITGTVTDAGGTPLPGVKVTAEAERGAKETFTDPQGSFRFALLVPARYTVRSELEGMQTAEAITTVNAGGSAEVNLKMTMGTEETITVTSEAPMVDKFNVTAGTTVSAEIGEQTAGTTRTYYGVINTLPGVTADAENDDIQQTRPSVNGTHFADQQVFIDGVDTTFAKFGGSRVFVPTTATTEVSMEAGGSSAEYGRAIGSSTNVIVKSGTNQFHGAGLIQRQEIKWGGDYKEQPALENREVNPVSRDFLFRSPIEEDGASTGYEFSFGGPISRDKAWFFLGLSQFGDNYIEKGLGGDAIDTSLENQALIAKFNFQPGTSHQVAASYMNTPAERVYFNPETFDYWTPTPHDVEGTLASLNWNWSINSNVFVEAKVATQSSTENKQLACGSVIIADCLAQKQRDNGGPFVGSADQGDGPLRFPSSQDHPFLPPEALGEHYPGDNYRVYLDTNFFGAWHNGWILSDGFGNNDFPRQQANASATQFIGQNHEFKYGLDYQKTEWTGDSSRPGLYSGYNFDSLNPFGYANAGAFGENTCGVVRSLGSSSALWPTFGRGQFCLYRDYNADFLTSDRGSGDSSTENLAFYVRDRFSAGDRWTFNVGFRLEDQAGFNDINREVFGDTYISPRFNTAYDIKGDGRMLVTANIGRYHALLNQEWIAQNLHDQWNGFEGWRDWLFCDPLDVSLGVCSEVGYGLINAEIRPGEIWDFVDAGLWDSNITPYYKDELILGFEWQFSRNWALDAKGIMWELKDLIGATSQFGPEGQQFQFTANYKDWRDILGGLEDARLANGLEPLLTDDILNAFDEGVNKYQALQLQFNRRFSDGWALYNNVTFSETETTGAGDWWNNTNSSYGEDLHVTLSDDNITECIQDQQTRSVPVPQLCADLSRFLGTSASTINRLGKNGNIDKPIILNSFGFKTWQVGRQDLTLGGNLNFQSGVPWARSESVSTFTLEGSNAANTSVGLPLGPIGSNGWRLASSYALNLSGAWGFPMGGKNLRGEFRAEVLNVTDQQRQRLITGRGEARPVRRDFQRPRQLRASFSIKF